MKNKNAREIASNPQSALKVALSGGDVRTYKMLEDKARQTSDKASKQLKKARKMERQNRKRGRQKGAKK